MFQKTIIYTCKLCGVVAEITTFYLALASNNPIPASRVRFIAIMVLVAMFGCILEHLKISWSWDSIYDNGSNNDCE